jgi:hypothetical protein
MTRTINRFVVANAIKQSACQENNLETNDNFGSGRHKSVGAP